MMTNLDNALNHALKMSEYYLEGWVSQEPNEPIWYIDFVTPRDSSDNEDPKTPEVRQALLVEVIWRNGGIIASVLNKVNMSNREVATLMELLLEKIEVLDMPPLYDCEEVDDYEGMPPMEVG